MAVSRNKSRANIWAGIDAATEVAGVVAAQAAADAAQVDATQAIADALAAQTDATQAIADALAAQTDATTGIADAATAQAAVDALELKSDIVASKAANNTVATIATASMPNTTHSVKLVDEAGATVGYLAVYANATLT